MNVDGGLAFLDTNILIYTDDSSAPAKQKLATSLVAAHGSAGTLVISLQVLQEYFAAATRKLKVDPAVAQRKVELLARGKVVRFTERDVISAIELHRVAQISFWDAMIVHAARSVNATVLYTEDLAHGASIAGVPIRNPFTAGHEPIFTENKTI
jgi:predicted nucleic acid-binding protein